MLELTALRGVAKEVLFEGADKGQPEPGRPVVPYQRSLPLDVALHPDTLLAYEMNGEPLLEDHGRPLRLVVPGWYGMASVKWLHRITVLDHSFKGFFQTERYVLLGDRGSSMPLTSVFVKSLISRPRHGEVYGLGEQSCDWAGMVWTRQDKSGGRQ